MAVGHQLLDMAQTSFLYQNVRRRRFPANPWSDVGT